VNKLYSDGKDGKLVTLILEPGNIHKLVSERKPIEVKLNEGPFEGGLPAKMSVVILYSETPIRDAREIAKMVKPSGTLVDQRTPVVEKQRPHCPECHSTIEQLGMWQGDECPIVILFCAMCGCTLGTMPRAALEKR